MEARFDETQWLVGDQLTESDIRAFVTLIRFDSRTTVSSNATCACSRGLSRGVFRVPGSAAGSAFAASVRSSRSHQGRLLLDQGTNPGHRPNRPASRTLPRDDALRLL